MLGSKERTGTLLVPFLKIHVDETVLSIAKEWFHILGNSGLPIYRHSTEKDSAL